MATSCSFAWTRGCHLPTCCQCSSVSWGFAALLMGCVRLTFGAYCMVCALCSCSICAAAGDFECAALINHIQNVKPVSIKP